MDPVELANRALNWLKDNYYSAPSTALYKVLDLHEWPDRNFLIDCLKRLERNGIVSKEGTKKYFWRVTDPDWNIENPFGSVGAPRPRKTRGMSGNKEEVVKKLIHDEVETQLENVVSHIYKRVKKGVEVSGGIKTEITIKTLDGKQLGKLSTKTHQKFERCLRLAGARRNILLIGPAGCGKSYLASQIANALSLPSGHISCSAGMSEGQLLGRLLPTGEGGRFEYCRSEFVKFYEEGGVWLFDELDGADSNTLLVLNPCLTTSGYLSVPNRMENPIAKRHPDFVLIAAANTYGTGADRRYVGRNQLDESTIDRFRRGQVEMTYDENLESVLCPDNELRELLQGYRRKVEEAKLERIVSTRFLEDSYIMAQHGDTIKDMEIALFSGWSKDELSKIGKYAG